MRRLNAFNSVSLDGYFTAVGGDMSWAYGIPDDPEYNRFVAENAQRGGVLMFGRITYDMMAGFWPTPAATAKNAVVAKRMNAMEKLVVSRTLTATPWSNSSLVKGDLIAAVKKLKKSAGDGITILGSGSIVAQLMAHGLIDEFQVVVNPIVLGAGRTMFEGLPKPVPLKLTQSRSFANGKTMLSYTPGG